MGKIFIIAEAGVNHNGDPVLAHKLVDMAVYAGADAIKFQTFRAKSLVSNSAPMAGYQETNLEETGTQYQMLEKLELNENTFRELKEHADASGIEFISSPFDDESIDLLFNLGMQTFKIPSGEITNLPYLRHIGSLKKKVILSTGMSCLGEIETAIGILTESGTKRTDISLLHATTEYPAPLAEVNLNALVTMRNAFKLPVGYSDHTSGLEIPCAAAAMGASIIEKHFTLDRNMKGPDHKASLPVEEFKQMVQYIRNIEKAMGSGIKEATVSERKNIAIVRKSIHYRSILKAGHVLTAEDLMMKRPGSGISPMLLELVEGRSLKHDVRADAIVLWEDLA